MDAANIGVTTAVLFLQYPGFCLPLNCRDHPEYRTVPHCWNQLSYYLDHHSPLLNQMGHGQ
jgi:hypothetical protein